MAISRKLSAMSDEQRDVRRYVKLGYFAMAACGLAAFAYLGGESDAHLASEGAPHRRRLGGGGGVVGWGKGKVKLDCHYMNPLYNYSDNAEAPDHYRQLAEGQYPVVKGGNGLPDTAPPCPPAPPFKVHSCEVLYWDLSDFDTSGGVALWLFIMFYCFVGIAIVCDDFFVEAIEEVVEVLKIPEDVAGATFMAVGSSAPEFFTVIIATMVTESDEGIGDIVGAAVFNSMTIVGLTCIFAGQTLVITKFPVLRDFSFYLLSIILLFLFALDQQILWYESLLLLLGYASYVFWMTKNRKIARAMYNRGGFLKFLTADYIADVERRAKEAEEKEAKKAAKEEGDAEAGEPKPKVGGVAFTPTAYDANAEGADKSSAASAAPAASPAGSAKPSFIRTLSFTLRNSKSFVLFKKNTSAFKCIGKVQKAFAWPLTMAFKLSMPESIRDKCKYWFMWNFVMSVAWICILITCVLIFTTRVGCILNIPGIVMGTIVLSSGTSVPDSLSSIIVARKGEGDMAIANVLGSNIFNIFVCLGFSWMLWNISEGPYEANALKGNLWFPIMIVLVYSCFLLIAFIVSRWRLTKPLGFSLIFLHMTFIALTLLTNSIGGKKPVLLLPNTPGWSD